MRIVAALGGNALLQRGQPLTHENQRANVRRAAAALAPLCTAGHEVVITHGNGPQVGLLALQAAAGPRDAQQPLDVLNAESEGMLGYLIAQELRNALPQGREVVSILSQVVVEADDPAFGQPTKPIGPVYSEAEAQRMSDERGWAIVQDGEGWRRAVPSPEPVAVLETDAIARLVPLGFIVICVGGGGIPVVRHADGRLDGIEAVIDKDRASGLLARELGASQLLLLTDVDAVYLGWRTAEQRAVASAGPDDLDPSVFEAGTMRPKVSAATSFVRETGHRAAIGRIEDVSGLIAGTAGTQIERTATGLQFRG
jgi:carbamate kinase